MRLLVQQVKSAELSIEKENINRVIWRWLVIYLGISTEDLNNYQDKIARIVKKIPVLKCLTWEDWNITTSLEDIQWEVLLISNFSLYWRSLKGTKLDFVHSAPYKKAEEIYYYFIQESKKEWWRLQTWEFWVDMVVHAVNDWPLNYVLDY